MILSPVLATARLWRSFYNTTGDNTLNGGAGDDNLNVDYSTGDNLLNGDNGNDYLSASGYEYDDSGDEKGVYRRASGNNTLNGGTGADKLIVDYSTGNNLLLGVMVMITSLHLAH